VERDELATTLIPSTCVGQQMRHNAQGWLATFASHGGSPGAAGGLYASERRARHSPSRPTSRSPGRTLYAAAPG
jgi:hypothetical protein